MKNKRCSISQKEIIFQDILSEMKNSAIKTTTMKKIKQMFLKKGCTINNANFKTLKIREQLIQARIHYAHVHPEEKKLLFTKVLKILIAKGITNTSNEALINLIREEYGVSIRKEEIKDLGLWTLLKKNGIENKYSSSSKIHIIDQVINYVLENKIKVNSVTQLYEYARQFGNVSRSTLDNHLDYIQNHIPIKNIKETKRVKALEMSDKEIMTQAAIYYVKKNICKINAGELRKYTRERYRTVDIEVIKKYRNFFAEKYNLEIISTDNKQNNQNYHMENVLNFLETKVSLYTVRGVEVIDKNILNNPRSNTFIFDVGLVKKLKLFWNEYTILYISKLAKDRINVKNAFLFKDSNNLKVDTEKKEVILLKHKQLNIETMTLLKFIKLTMLTHKASNKAYGIHMQNMYIGFLFFLHSKNQLIIPFSYLYDICYAKGKVQIELELFLAEHPINKQFLQAIKENRLNVKDDKYKRIFQFFLLCIPNSKPASKVLYKDLSPLQDRNDKNFKRVVNIFNALGANINTNKAKVKYTEKYNMYKKYQKYSKLIELFNKTMNRACKLGDYSKEENIYKGWSTQYAYFFDFIEENYTNSIISENFLYEIFNYPDEEKTLTYQEYIQEQRLSANSKDNRFTPLIIAFSNSDTYSSLNRLKDKKPIFKNTSESDHLRQQRAPITNPIVLAKLEDILRKRPPKSNYFSCLNVNKKYTSWWPHYKIIAPFEPLILLMHLYIPARGINFRLADRNSFLIKNNQGTITGYHFTHDKNKKRKKPYVAPNIWGDDLKIVENFIEYSKIHFNVLKPIIYDKQNPKGILPLFPNNKGTSFYSESQHMKYWKRVLLKAQIELNNENNEENITLIFPNSDIEIPKNPGAVDQLSQGDMEKFQVKYDLHSLRHTGATKYANAGMPLGLLALLTGHTDMNVLQSVYIELNAQKMLEMWKNIQNVNIGNGSLSEAGKKFIHHTKIDAKEILVEKSPEKLLRFLEERNFISIGSFVNKDELTLYTLEDFSKINPVFWSFRRYGICTSAQCPQGLENRCSLCPHFITSPAYIQEVVAQINLQNHRIAKYGNIVIKNRKEGNSQNNENIRKSAQIEIEDMFGWIKILQAIDEIRLMVNDNERLYGDNKNLTKQDMKEMSIFSLAPIVNGDHSLLKLVYDSIELKEFEHESFHDASEKLVSKIIRYAARNNAFDEIDGKDKYQIIEWFRPVYREVLSLERDESQKDKLVNILNFLSDKPSGNMIRQNETLFLESKESE